MVRKRMHNYLVEKHKLPGGLKYQEPEVETLLFWGRASHGRNPYTRRISFPLWLAIDVFALCYTILRVEFTVALNSISGVNKIFTAGQLIAFVVALGGCLLVAMQLGRETRPDDYCSLLHEQEY